MLFKKTVESSMNIYIVVRFDDNGRDKELLTRDESGILLSFYSHDIVGYLEDLPVGEYEVTITAKLLDK